MSSIPDRPSKVHEGHNVKRFREMLGIRLEALVIALGEDWSEKRVAVLESKETIEPAVLEEVAKALRVPVEAIRNFDEEKAVVNIQNNYQGSSSNFSGLNHCTFNPLDKLVFAFEEIKLLHEENRKLYERLLQSEQEKNTMLRSQLKR